MKTSWKMRFKKLFKLCRNEVKKTTQISKKMISASKTSSELSQAYQDLGSLAFEDLKREAIEWKNPKAKKLIHDIEQYESNLQVLEDDVHKLKKSRSLEHH